MCFGKLSVTFKINVMRSVNWIWILKLVFVYVLEEEVVLTPQNYGKCHSQRVTQRSRSWPYFVVTQQSTTWPHTLVSFSFFELKFWFGLVRFSFIKVNLNWNQALLHLHKMI